jgi:hypothetical protein
MKAVVGPFPGTTEERDALLLAVGHACGCPSAATDTPRSGGVCGAHTLLLNEPRLKALIFYRRWQAALQRGEWLLHPAWSGDPQPL